MTVEQPGRERLRVHTRFEPGQSGSGPAHPGRIVFAWLVRQGWTQKQLADALHRSESAIGDLINAKNERGVNAVLAVDIESVTGLSANELMHADADYRVWRVRSRAQ